VTQTADLCVILRHLRHPMTKVYVTGDAPPGSYVTPKPQVRGANDADDAGDAEIRTSDTRTLALARARSTASQPTEGHLTQPRHGHEESPTMATEEPTDPRALLRGGLPDRYLTPEDLVTMFSLPSVETVYQWRRKRIGPAGFRVGRYLRFNPAAVQAWEAERTALEDAA
jgi:hypothetical protein